MGVSAAAGIFLLVLDVPENLDDMIGDMMGFRASGRQLVRLPTLPERRNICAGETHGVYFLRSSSSGYDVADNCCC
jgi:hypothetical protein